MNLDKQIHRYQCYKEDQYKLHQSCFDSYSTNDAALPDYPQ